MFCLLTIYQNPRRKQMTDSIFAKNPDRIVVNRTFQNEIYSSWVKYLSGFRCLRKSIVLYTSEGNPVVEEGDGMNR